MKRTIKLLSLLLLLIMLVQSTIVSVFAVLPLDIGTDFYQAASGTGYTQSSDVEYRKSGSYIYNWGARGEDATFLSTYAVKFYTSGYTFEVLSLKSGSSVESSVPSSALYSALKTLMSSKQTKQTSYNDTRSLFRYTDCEMNGNSISSFYSGVAIGPAWDSGSTWNREHTWPNSKGDASGNGENDIMMLRPTSTKENSSRGNKAYGEGSSYYNPNSESGGKYDLRGDVARIVLYTYVRWGCTNTGSKYNPNGITGVNGVIQSIDVLLKWMEEDEVDTWEMGRNDAVQSITGTRNVFVDYPEYAWLLFGEEIPDNMVTPSGNAKVEEHHWNGGVVTTQPTCTQDGIKTYTCTDSGCGETQTEVIKATGHSYGDWIIDLEPTETTTGSKYRVCGNCNDRETQSIPVLGHTHKYTATVTDPTCENKGYTTHKCTCGDSYVDSYTDKLEHKFSNGLCSLCGAKDPSAPTFTTDDFSNIVSALVAGRYIGQNKYNKICEAVNVYNSLSADDKKSVSGKYDVLISIVNQYNDDVHTVNHDSSVLGLLPTVIVDVSVLWAVYTVLNKKYF